MGTVDVEIRAATAEDLDGLLALYAALAEDRAGAQPAGREESAPILAAIIEDPRRAVLVAVYGDRLVGTVDLLVVPNLTRGGRPWAVVENMIVDPGRRRTGIGSRLMEEVRRRAVAAGCYKVQLLSRKHRVEAHAFYESVGFEAVAEGLRCYFDT